MRSKPLLLLMPLALATCWPDAGIRGTYVLTSHGREQRYASSDSGTFSVDVEPKATGQYRTRSDTLLMEIQMPDFATQPRSSTETMRFVLRGDTLRSEDKHAFFMVRER